MQSCQVPEMPSLQLLKSWLRQYEVICLVRAGVEPAIGQIMCFPD